MDYKGIPQEIDLYLLSELTSICLKPRSKQLLVRLGHGWNAICQEFERWFANPKANIGLRCGDNLAVVDCDYEEAFHNITVTHDLATGCPVIRTGPGNHIWLKPIRPIQSRHLNGVEIRCLAYYVVAPSSVQPSGTPCLFDVPLMRPFSSGVYLCWLGLSCGKYIISSEVTR